LDCHFTWPAISSKNFVREAERGVVESHVQLVPLGKKAKLLRLDVIGRLDLNAAFAMKDSAKTTE